ncbi:cation diffusion facilitator family transporter [Neorhizobium sp. LMR1-1-1.1]
MNRTHRFCLPGKLRSELRIVFIALVADLLVAAFKFVAAAQSGSASMSSEGVHSLIDASTEIILLYGLFVSAKTATPEHQLGFGREVFFWNFVVAVLIFALGSGIAFLDGIQQMMSPRPIENVELNYLVLSISGVAELVALWLALGGANSKKGGQSLFRSLRRRRDPTALTILFGGAAAILGLVATAVGLSLSVTFGDPRFDGATSVAIALILALTAFKLASESKALLIGVPADESVVTAIVTDVRARPAVMTVNGMVSVHLAPDQLLVAISIWFDDALSKKGVEAEIEGIEEDLYKTNPQIVALFIKPQTPARYAALHGDAPSLTTLWRPLRDASSIRPVGLERLGPD